MKIQKFFVKVGFYAKKYAPEIMTYTGLGLMVASTIVACASVPKAQRALAEAEANYESIETAKKKAETNKDFAKKYTEEDYINARKIVSVQTTKSMIFTYAPAAAIGIAGASFILAGMGIMRSRYTALASAYTALNVAFEKYRGRVADKYGEEEEYKILHDIHEEIVDEKTVDPETGEEKVTHKVKQVAGADDLYTFVFNEHTSSKWDPDVYANIRFLEGMQQWAYHKLMRSGYVCLRDILENLGLEPTAESFDIGWVYDLEAHDRDNFVSFGAEAQALFENPSPADVIEKGKDGIKLRFNPDGCISYLFSTRM